MGEIQKLRMRARRSRSRGFDEPIVSTRAEAEDLARAIADELAMATPQDALLCLAALSEVQAALEARLAQLDAEMAETRGQLTTARNGAKACLTYGQAASARKDGY